MGFKHYKEKFEKKKDKLEDKIKDKAKDVKHYVKKKITRLGREIKDELDDFGDALVKAHLKMPGISKLTSYLERKSTRDGSSLARYFLDQAHQFRAAASPEYATDELGLSTKQRRAIQAKVGATVASSLVTFGVAGGLVGAGISVAGAVATQRRDADVFKEQTGVGVPSKLKKAGYIKAAGSAVAGILGGAAGGVVSELGGGELVSTVASKAFELGGHYAVDYQTGKLAAAGTRELDAALIAKFGAPAQLPTAAAAGAATGAKISAPAAAGAQLPPNAVVLDPGATWTSSAAPAAVPSGPAAPADAGPLALVAALLVAFL